jgi:hypothetical protein
LRVPPPDFEHPRAHLLDQPVVHSPSLDQRLVQAPSVRVDQP